MTTQEQIDYMKKEFKARDKLCKGWVAHGTMKPDKMETELAPYLAIIRNLEKMRKLEPVIEKVVPVLQVTGFGAYADMLRVV